ncbi:creatininase family protein [Paramicrobacterium agarici]|uniref:creatininase family protein n=1 Tax=Paramicrobacterium agarici TaxID=630514 RepID=UPI0011683439|nr:creatininase family protein [Microbacterium agarici]TQO23311.1 creatinine amidohydrolase [Microbacterium agarici]
MTDTIDTPEQFLLAQMTWPEAKAAVTRSPLAIVPTGACEQHGAHMSLDTDTVRAEGFSRRLAEELAPLAVVTPCLTPGVSSHHMAFAGTLAVSPLTFQQMLYEVVESLYAHGWRSVFIVNGHGGNMSACGVAASRLQADFPDLKIAWTGITSLVSDVALEHTVGPKAAHSSEIETSQTLYFAPSRVRSAVLDEARESGTTPERYPGVAGVSGIKAPRPFHKVSPDGATGTPSAATAELGEKLIETAVTRATAFLESFIADSAAAPA